jgi:uncharacterized repeat protein (TIGR01451 family)
MWQKAVPRVLIAILSLLVVATALGGRQATHANLSIEQTVSDRAPSVGAIVTFTISVSGHAAMVRVSDRLPSGLHLVTSRASRGSYSRRAALWTVGSLSPRRTAQLTIEARVASSDPQVNTATIVGTHKSASVTIRPRAEVAAGADLALTQTVDNASPKVGATVHFTLVLADNGPDTATHVAVTEHLPAGVFLVEGTPTQGTYSAATGIWNVGTVTTKTRQTLKLEITVNQANGQTMTATVSHADQHDPNTANNTVTTFFQAQPGSVAAPSHA